MRMNAHAHNLTATIFFIDFSKVFDFIHRGKMAEISNAYSIPDEIISDIMIAYKNTKYIMRTDDGDTEFIKSTGVVFQGVYLSPFSFHKLFSLCFEEIIRPK